MSEVSVLSREYKTAADLSKAMSHALLVLKRASLGVEATPTTSSDLKHARRELASIVAALANLLDPATPAHGDTTTAARIPGAVVARFQAEQRPKLDSYVEALRTTAGRLHEDPTGLSEDDLALLDGLTAAVDAEASRVYRRLMRR
jgi:hypothetical protein